MYQHLPSTVAVPFSKPFRTSNHVTQKAITLQWNKFLTEHEQETHYRELPYD